MIDTFGVLVEPDNKGAIVEWKVDEDKTEKVVLENMSFPCFAGSHTHVGHQQLARAGDLDMIAASGK